MLAVPHQFHVLVIDDEPPLREIMADALTAEGYRVTTAGNGAEALERLADDRPDLIVLDLRLPVLDGWTFIDRFRALAGAEVPIISISAAMSQLTADHLRQLGVRVCLSKPFDLEQLARSVAEALASADASGWATTAAPDDATTAPMASPA